jgi:aldose sugar dehydrogenase
MRHASFLLFTLIALACQDSGRPKGPAHASSQPAFTQDVLTAETVASGLEYPWGFEFLPDGRIIVTERLGRIRIVGMDGRLSAPLEGVPAVLARPQAGIHDVALDPDFATNRTIYLTFVEPGDGGAGTSVARARLARGDGALENVEILYRQQPQVSAEGHYGSRIVHRSDGTMFIALGDRGTWRKQPQDLTSGLGKVIRIKSDGSIPSDNPFVGRSDARPEIWTYGHRNIQGALLHPGTGQLWTIEHGAAGGDELNRPERGKNYGWSTITYGLDYEGRRIGEGAVKEGMEQPAYYWDPVIAPSGMELYTGNRYPGWNGSFLVGSLSPGGLVRLEMRGDSVVKEERYLGDLRERIRDVKQGLDGFVYLITDNPKGRILRVLPKP